jgi:hypothetical protein
MKALAIICSLAASLGLFITADCRWGFAPLPLRGPEAGLIVGSLAFFAGLVASILATLFAFVALCRSTNRRGPAFLLGCGCTLLLGLAVFFVI